MRNRPYIAAAMLGLMLAAAAPPPPAAVPSSPDNETTALAPRTDTHLGMTPNSLGTVTNTGTSAQRSGSGAKPAMVPENPAASRAKAGARGAQHTRSPDISQFGHTMSGNFAGMGGAPDASATMPLNPYVPVLGGGRNGSPNSAK